MLAACGGGDDPLKPENPFDPDPNPQPKSEIKFSGSTAPAPVFTSEGGSSTVSFTATDAWTASVANTRSENWCSVSPVSGAAGNATITITAQPNSTHDNRSAVITLKSGTAARAITVTQKQKDALTVTQNRFDVGEEGGSITIEVKANIQFEYKVDEASASWIKAVETRALSTTTLQFSVDENFDLASREGKITISSGNLSEIVTICQESGKPTIIFGQKNYLIESAQTTLKVEVSSNVDVAVSILDPEWITESATRAMSTHTYNFNIAENSGDTDRTGKIVFMNTENAFSDTVYVKQLKPETRLDRERKILIEFYKVTNGAIWTDKTNWCSDKPVGEWFGITTDEQGYVSRIEMIRNSLVGTIPASVGELVNLKYFNVHGNRLKGEIPESFYNLKELEILNLGNNQFTGTLSNSIGNFVKATYINVGDNPLEGDIPETLTEMPVWRACWPFFFRGTNFNKENVYIPAPKFSSITTIDGKNLSDEVYKENKLTALFFWAASSGPSTVFIPELKAIYDNYKEKGFDVLSYTRQTDENSIKYNTENGITWNTFRYGTAENSEFLLYTLDMPTVCLVNRKGVIVFNSIVNDINLLGAFVEDYLSENNSNSDGNVDDIPIIPW